MTGPGQGVLAGAHWRGGGGVSRLVEGSGGGKIDSVGWRDFESRGYWAAIITHIHGFFSVDTNPMPHGRPYIGVLPSTLTLHDSYPCVTRLMTHSES